MLQRGDNCTLGKKTTAQGEETQLHPVLRGGESRAGAAGTGGGRQTDCA